MSALSFAYLAALLVSLAGVATLDLRFRLFVGRDPRRGIAVLALGVAFFVVWDLIGVGAGIFFRGAPELLTGVLIAPEVPLEELFFLTLLCWTTMVLVTGMRRLLGARRVAGASGAPPASPDGPEGGVS
ncbi:MAG: lycopene cyclase domain-containing protein [Actinomycetales bacterium]|nr:lycopene cyclase domain-containing protein [Actinomycetales bacterium]